MITKTIDDEISRGIASGSLDGVAWASGAWTALGVDSAIEDLQRGAGEEFRVLVCIHPIKAGNYIVDEENFASQKLPGVEFRLVQKPPSLGSPGKGLVSLLKFLLRGPATEGRAFHLIQWGTRAPFAVRYLVEAGQNGKRPLFVHLIDEGFSSNASLRLRCLTAVYSTAQTLGRLQEKLLHARHLMIQCVDKLVQTAVELRFPVRRRYLLQPSGDELVADAEMVGSYRRILGTHNKPSSGPTRDAFILTQPFLDYLQDTRVRDLMGSMAARLKRHGYRPLIKVHPRETSNPVPKRFHGLEEFLWSETKSVEALLAKSRPAMVVGFSSTSLISAPLLFDVPAISAANLLLECGSHPFVNVNIREFRLKARNLLKFADTLEEFENVVSTMASIS